MRATVSVSTLVLRLLVASLPVLAMLAGRPAGARAGTAILVVVLTLSVLAAVLPDSPAGAVATLVVMSWWVIALEGRATGWVLLAAVALAGAHVATTVAASAPLRGRIPLAVLRPWLLRWGLMAGAAAGSWLLVLGLEAVPGGALVWPVGMLTAALVAVGALLLLRGGSTA